MATTDASYSVNSTGNEGGDDEISTERIVIGTVLLVMVAITIIGNTIVLVAFALERKLRNTFTYYIANLAVTDLMVGSTAMLFYAFDTMMGYWPFGQFMCAVWIFFDYGMTFASVFTLVAISLDRYWAVNWSVHYRLHNTRQKSAIIIFTVWFLVLAIWLAPFILDRIKWSEPRVCIWEPSRNEEFVVFIAVVGHHVPCAIMIFCYIRVFLLTKARMKVGPILRGKRNNNMRDISSSTVGITYNETAMETVAATTLPPAIVYPSVNKHTLALPGANTRSQNNAYVNTNAQITVAPQSKPQKVKSVNSEARDRRIFITMSYIIFTYLICWVPFHIIFDISAVYPDLVPSKVYTMGFWLAYVNSTLNPILYAYSNKDFRAAFLRVITCQYSHKKK